MLFGREYMPEGAGVDPDAPRKKGVARLVEILSRDLDGIFLSGALALLVCVPAAVLVGIALWLGSLPLCLLAAAAAGWLVGSALTCLYDTILRALRDEPGFWWHTYKRVWKQNFKSSLVPGAVFTLLWALVTYAAFVLPQMTTVPAGFALVLLLDMVLLLTLGSYYWMQNALFDAPVSKKLSNCVRMLLGFLPRTALSAAFQLGYWLLMAVVIPRCAFIFLLTGLWLPNLLAMLAVYAPIEKSLHLEDQIQAKREND